jgi:hypothetical protein
MHFHKIITKQFQDMPATQKEKRATNHVPLLLEERVREEGSGASEGLPLVRHRRPRLRGAREQRVEVRRRVVRRELVKEVSFHSALDMLLLHPEHLYNWVSREFKAIAVYFYSERDMTLSFIQYSNEKSHCRKYLGFLD